MAGKLYSKPILFSVVATVVVLLGTIATMAYPMLRPEMHPKVDGLKPLGALELAGRDIYQREGCVNCHTQTVRPLGSEVVRYKGSRAAEPSGRYSLAGEFAYDHPFLWGSKRTGPDLAFEGWLKPSKDWHVAHYENPQALVPKSNMPRYAFLKDAKLDGAESAAHMRALRRLGVPYGDDAAILALAREVEGKTEMEALVAYTLSLGKAVDRGGKGELELDLAAANPHQDAASVARGRKVYDAQGCGACHGDEAGGQEGVAPSLVDDTFLAVKGDLPDAAYFAVIKGGSDVKKQLGRPGLADGGMQAFGGELSDDDIWSVVAWLRNQKGHEASEAPHEEAAEHKHQERRP